VDDCGLAPLNQSSPSIEMKIIQCYCTITAFCLCQSVSLGDSERAKETKIIYLTCIRFPSWAI